MSAAILPGADRASFAVALAMRLRSRRVSVDLSALDGLVRALGGSVVRSRSQLYWVCRITLVRRQSQLADFDAVFESVFGDAVLAVDPDARRTPLGTAPHDRDLPGEHTGAGARDAGGASLPWIGPVAAAADATRVEAARVVPERLPSEIDALADRPFETLSAADLAVLGTWIESAIGAWPTRRTRRRLVDRNGRQIAIRDTIRRSRRTGWEPVQLMRVVAKEQPRRIVMLCDVSQSMQAQTGAYLHLMRAVAMRTDAEVFAFATRLTRLTAILRHRSATVALELATDRVADRFGGTRIAHNLSTFLGSRYGGYARGAIVVIGSDGWDSDSASQLDAAMARLRRRAHRVIWMNPRADAPRFEPRVATMAAALPYCDDFLPAGTFRSLARVVSAIVSSRA